jgi:hypothetical protein
MRTTRRWTLLAFLAVIVGVAVLGASPAMADVDCADLKTQGAAQSYLEGRTGDPDRLDADFDGQACEQSETGTHGNWTLIALGVLLAGGLVRIATDADRQARRRPVTVPAEAAEEQVREPVPALAVTSVEQVTADGMPVPVKTKTVFAQATVGTLSELARALRLVSYAQRMAMLESHAEAHGSAPQDVLDALAQHTSDLELQGWALAGYDPPWFVRPMYCDCVGGLRNYRLLTAEDGTHFWACASCNSRDRSTS